MIKYPTLPIPPLGRYIHRRSTHSTNVSYHYHAVEEWLQVVEGQMTFFPAGGLAPDANFLPTDELAFVLNPGEALWLPRGEAHRAEFGPTGATYDMWTPPYEDPFSHTLEEEDVALIKKNLHLPQVENYLDAHSHGPAAPEDQQYQDFLADFVSEDLTFRTAGGKLLVGKEAYLNRQPAQTTRYASASVSLVHKTPESVLLSTQVHTRPEGEGSPQSYSNTRLFVKKDDQWKCRIWINYPESAIV